MQDKGRVVVRRVIAMSPCRLANIYTNSQSFHLIWVTMWHHDITPHNSTSFSVYQERQDDKTNVRQHCVWRASLATRWIKQRLPVQTGITSSRVTVYGGNEALSRFRFTVTRELDFPICTDSQCLILFLAAGVWYFFLHITYRLFSEQKLQKPIFSLMHFFLIVAYELTTSFITVIWRHDKNAIYS
jgi:hypothetical protein